MQQGNNTGIGSGGSKNDGNVMIDHNNGDDDDQDDDNIMSTTIRLFSALPPKNLQPTVFYCFLTESKCLQCGLLHPASCTDRAIYDFLNKTQRPPGPKIFSSEL